MKKILSAGIIASVSSILLFLSCAKNNTEPTRLGRIHLSNITRNAVYCWDSVFGNAIQTKGFCLDTAPNPSLLHSLMSTTVAGNFLADTIKGLHYNTHYYVRAYGITGRDTLYSDQGSFNTVGAIAAPGQQYNGGYVFYVDSTGEHGLIAAPVDVGRYKWQNCPFLIFKEVPDSRWAIGSGMSNTRRIVDSIPVMNAICGTRDSIAAQVCFNLVLNGYDDWYLPSYNELNTFKWYCYDHPSFTHGLVMDFYWSSTEGDLYSSCIIAGPYATTNGNSYWDKTSYFAVRPMRSF